MSYTELKIHRQFIEEVRSKLRQYLQDMGHRIPDSGNMQCPIPGCSHTHGDSTPSCGFIPGSDEKVVRCHKTGVVADIFHMAHLVEGMPIGKDPRFYTVTVAQLAQRYGLLCDLPELSDEEKDRLRMERAYNDSAITISTCSGDVSSMASTRGWTMESIRRFQIGRVGYATYIDAMEKLGWSPDYLESIGLRDEPNGSGRKISLLINSNLLTFPVRDDNGQVVGFASRNLDFNENDDPEKKKKDPKYRNSPNSYLYNKGKVIYNLNRCDASKPLWIVEGYGDVLTLDSAGEKNIAALGQSHLTEGQATLLMSGGYRDIILCYDGDKAGREAMPKSIRLLREVSLFRIQVCPLPDGEDPCSFVSKNGLSALKSLPLQSAFKYMLSIEAKDMDTEKISEIYVPMIIDIASPVSRESMIQDLSEYAGMPVNVIREEVDFRKYESARLIEHERGNIQERLQKQLYRGGNHMQIINAATELSQLEDRAKKKRRPDQQYREMLRDLFMSYKDPLVACGFVTPRFSKLQSLLDGFPRKGALICVGGRSQAGKSTWCRNLALDLARHNDEVIVLYITLDDTYQAVSTAWLATLSGLEVEQIVRRTSLKGEDAKKWDTATKWLENRKNLHSVGSEFGRRPEDIAKTVEYFIKTYTGQTVITFVDNFHDIDFGSNIREGVVNNIKYLKDISTSSSMPIVFTAQTRKDTPSDKDYFQGDEYYKIMKRRKVPADLSESGQIEYNADVVLMVHSDLQIWPGTWMKWNYNGASMPILDVYMWKNKIRGKLTEGFTDSMFYKLNRVTSTVDEILYKDLPKRESQREYDLRQNPWDSPWDSPEVQP